jgi:hypothetical protein
VDVLLPAWRENNVDVEVLTPGERPDRAFRDKVVELRIQNYDHEHEVKDSCKREGIGHCVWSDYVGIDLNQGAHQRLRTSGRSHKNQERGGGGGSRRELVCVL